MIFVIPSHRPRTPHMASTQLSSHDTIQSNPIHHTFLPGSSCLMRLHHHNYNPGRIMKHTRPDLFSLSFPAWPRTCEIKDILPYFVLLISWGRLAGCTGLHTRPVSWSDHQHKHTTSKIFINPLPPVQA